MRKSINKALSVLCALTLLLSCMAVGFVAFAADNSVMDFETGTQSDFVMQSANASGDAVLQSAIKHGGSKAAKFRVTVNNKSQRGRPRLVIKTGDATTAGNFEVQAGESYDVSFWLYSDKATAAPQYFTYYWATVNKANVATNIATTSNPGGADVHKLQVLSNINTGTPNGTNNEVAGIELQANTWTQFKATIPSVALHGTETGNTSYLSLGIAIAGSMANQDVYHFYVDDIEVKKSSGQSQGPVTDPNTLDFETGTASDLSFQAPANNGRPVFLETTDAHGGNKVGQFRVNAFASAQRQRPRIVLKTGDITTAGNFEVTEGKGYEVSFWVRTDVATTEDYKFTYYLATTDKANATANIAATSNPGGNDVHALQVLSNINVGTPNAAGTEIGDIALAANEWTEIKATIPAVTLHGGNPSVLTLGFTYSRTDLLPAGTNPLLWIDDIVVKEIITYDDTLMDFETGALSDFLYQAPANNGRTVLLETADAHSGNKVGQFRINQSAGAQRQRPRVIVKTGNAAENVHYQVKEGSEYKVSFWVRSDFTTTSDITFTYYIATVGKKSAASYIAGTAGEVHQLQVLDDINEGTLNSSNNEVTDISLTAGEWKQIKATVPAAALHGGKASLLSIGFSLTKAGQLPAGVNPLLWIDDIVVEGEPGSGDDITPAPTDAETLTFEVGAESDLIYQAPAQNGNPVFLETADAHTGTKVGQFRINSTAGAQRQRPRLVLKTGDITTSSNFEVTEGKTYSVSFWIRSDVSSTDRSKFTYYLATTDKANAAANIAATGNPGGNDVHALQVLDNFNEGTANAAGTEISGIDLVAGEWKRISATIPAATLHGGNPSVLTLGFTFTSCGLFPAGVNPMLWIDDVTVKEIVPVQVSNDTMDFETGTDADYMMQQANLPGETVLQSNIKHSGNSAAKFRVTVANKSQRARPRLVIKTGDVTTNGFYEVTEGKSYNVSFWLYSDRATDDVQKLTYYWATVNKANAATLVQTKEGDVHKLQQVSDQNIGEPNGGASTELKNIALEANTWTQFTATLPAITLHGDEPNGNSYLTLGLAISGSMANSDVYNFYVDDIQIKENIVVDDDVMDFETGTDADHVYQASNGGTNGILQDAVKVGGNKAAHFVVTDTNKTQRKRPRLLIKTGDATLTEGFAVTEGSGYDVSFWVYSDVATTVEKSFTYYFATTNKANAVANIAATDGDVHKLQKLDNINLGEYNSGDQTEVKGIVLAANTWTQIKATIPAVELHGTEADGTGYLTLGFAINGDMPANAVNFYVDEIKIKPMKRTFGEPDPNATVQSFERYNIGDTNLLNSTDSFVLKNRAEISDDYAHTGTQSLRLNTATWNGLDRNQFVIVDPATDKPMEFVIGKTYTIRFWVFMEEDMGIFNVNYWLMGTNNPNQEITDKKNAEYDMGGAGLIYSDFLETNDWFEMEISFTMENGKYLVMGITDRAAYAAGTAYYIDDISFEAAEMVTVQFDTNGSLDTVSSVEVIKGTPLVFGEDYVAPYREGYEFIGWYTSKECKEEDIFLVEDDDVMGNMTLYAGWKEWAEAPKKEPPKPEYITVYEEEKIYIGKYDNFDPTVQSGERPVLEDADPVEAKPVTDNDDDEPTKKDSSAWLIVVIIVIAVMIVGGGSVLTLVLLKKKKA